MKNKRAIILFACLSALIISLVMYFAFSNIDPSHNGGTDTDTVCSTSDQPDPDTEDHDTDGEDTSHESPSSDSEDTPDEPSLEWSVIGFKDKYTYDGEELALNTVNCPVIEEIDGLEIERINLALSQFCKDYVNISTTSKNELKSDYLSSVSDGRDFELSEKSADFTLHVRGKALSVLFSSSEVSGGANSERRYYALSFDLVSGERLKLSAFLGKDEEYTRNYLKDIFTNLIRSKPENFYDNALDMIDAAINTENYYLSEKGLVLYLDAYTISPSALGIQTVTVKYSDLP